MLPPFYARADGIKMLIFGMYFLLGLLGITCIWERVLIANFRFAIYPDFPPEDVPWYVNMPTALRDSTYIWSVYWILMIFTSEMFKFAFYVGTVIGTIAGLKRPWMYPIALSMLFGIDFIDIIRAVYAFYQSNNTNQCFLCWSQLLPYGDNSINTPNIFFIWYMRVNMAAAIIGFLLFLTIPALKILVTKLVPDERANGAIMTGDEAASIKRKAIQQSTIDFTPFAKRQRVNYQDMKSACKGQYGPSSRNTKPQSTTSSESTTQLEQKMLDKGLRGKKYVVRIVNIWTGDVYDDWI